MNDYKQQFIDQAIASKALSFGEFQLKSGRISPYFFNAGKFYTGGALATLGRCYAEAIVRSGIQFELLFGPAYKGITLAGATAVALSEHHQIDVPYSYNRKEEKSHGEGGSLVGAPLAGRVLIIDDVITAGTAVAEVMGLLAGSDAQPAGVLVGLDRRERGPDGRLATEVVERKHGVPVVSIVDITDVLEFLMARPELRKWCAAVASYRDTYGL